MILGQLYVYAKIITSSIQESTIEHCKFNFACEENIDYITPVSYLTQSYINTTALTGTADPRGRAEKTWVCVR